MRTLLTFGILFLLLVLVFYLFYPGMGNIFPAHLQSKKRKNLSTEFAQEVTPPDVQYLWKGSLADNKFGSQELPALNPAGELGLLVQNPNYLYAYWTLPEGENVSQHLLVFEHWGERCRQIFEFFLPLDKRECFINVPEANSTYHVELIRQLSDGTQNRLVSRIVTTPAAAISTVLDENWLPSGVYSYLGQISYGLSSAEVQQKRGEKH